MIDKNTRVSKKVKQKQQIYNNKNISTLLTAISILIFLAVIIKGNKGWLLLHNALLGIFGISVIILPIALLYTAYCIESAEDINHIKRIIFWSITSMIIFSSVIQLYFIGDLKGDNISAIIKELYNTGKHLKSGGVICILFAGIMLKLFGAIGAKIITIIIAISILLIIFNISPFQILNGFLNVFNIFQINKIDYDSCEDIEYYDVDSTDNTESDNDLIDVIPDNIDNSNHNILTTDNLSVSEINIDTDVVKAEMQKNADIIVNTFKNFKVDVEITDIVKGPVITRYELKPDAGVKVSKIKSLEDDVALNLGTEGVRLLAPVPGKSCIGIEVPNAEKDTVSLKEILDSKEFKSSESKLSFAIGKDITGNIIVGDIDKMPHLIIAGTTGSGKSVCTRSIIMSLLYNTIPDEVRIILIDPKIVEFKVFEGIPQLLIPVVTDPKKAAGALNWAVEEMLRRYNMFADNGANDLSSFNKYAINNNINTIPQIVIFIDELADLMMVSGKEVEDSICRLAQMGRASGIHLVIATQRPTTDVITGLIKANIPSRIALSVKSQIDSRTIIDTSGADKLLGNGDMLYAPIGLKDPIRVQGCYCSNDDIEKTVCKLKETSLQTYDDEIIQSVDDYVLNEGKQNNKSTQNKNKPKTQLVSEDSEDSSNSDNIIPRRHNLIKETPTFFNNANNADNIQNNIANNTSDSLHNGTAYNMSNNIKTSDNELINNAIAYIKDKDSITNVTLQKVLNVSYPKALKILNKLESMGYIGSQDGKKPRKVIK